MLTRGGIGDPNGMRQSTKEEKTHISRQLAREVLFHGKIQERIKRVAQLEVDQQRSGKTDTTKIKATKTTMEEGISPLLKDIKWEEQVVQVVDLCVDTVATSYIDIDQHTIEITSLPLNSVNTPNASIWDEQGLKRSIETLMLRTRKQHPSKQLVLLMFAAPGHQNSKVTEQQKVTWTEYLAQLILVMEWVERWKEQSQKVLGELPGNKTPQQTTSEPNLIPQRAEESICHGLPETMLQAQFQFIITKGINPAVTKHNWMALLDSKWFKLVQCTQAASHIKHQHGDGEWCKVHPRSGMTEPMELEYDTIWFKLQLGGADHCEVYESGPSIDTTNKMVVDASIFTQWAWSETQTAEYQNNMFIGKGWYSSHQLISNQIHNECNKGISLKQLVTTETQVIHFDCKKVVHELLVNRREEFTLWEARRSPPNRVLMEPHLTKLRQFRKDCPLFFMGMKALCSGVLVVITPQISHIRQTDMLEEMLEQTQEEYNVEGALPIGNNGVLVAIARKNGDQEEPTVMINRALHNTIRARDCNQWKYTVELASGEKLQLQRDDNITTGEIVAGSWEQAELEVAAEERKIQINNIPMMSYNGHRNWISKNLGLALELNSSNMTTQGWKFTLIKQHHLRHRASVMVTIASRLPISLTQLQKAVKKVGAVYAIVQGTIEQQQDEEDEEALAEMVDEDVLSEATPHPIQATKEIFCKPSSLPLELATIRQLNIRDLVELEEVNQALSTAQPLGIGPQWKGWNTGLTMKTTNSQHYINTTNNKSEPLPQPIDRITMAADMGVPANRKILPVVIQTSMWTMRWEEWPDISSIGILNTKDPIEANVDGQTRVLIEPSCKTGVMVTPQGKASQIKIITTNNKQPVLLLLVLAPTHPTLTKGDTTSPASEAELSATKILEQVQKQLAQLDMTLPEEERTKWVNQIEQKQNVQELITKPELLRELLQEQWASRKTDQQKPPQASINHSQIQEDIWECIAKTECRTTIVPTALKEKMKDLPQQKRKELACKVIQLLLQEIGLPDGSWWVEEVRRRQHIAVL